MSRPRDLVQGTLDLLVLRVIALEPMHGWAIGQRIRQMSNDALRGAERAVPRPPLTRVLVTAQKAKASAVCVNAEGARPLHQEPLAAHRVSALLAHRVRLPRTPRLMPSTSRPLPFATASCRSVARNEPRARRDMCRRHVQRFVEPAERQLHRPAASCL
jgi:hypothetical protein